MSEEDRLYIELLEHLLENNDEKKTDDEDYNDLFEFHINYK